MNRKVMIAEDRRDEVFIGKTDYFSAYKYFDEIKLADLSGNYTILDKYEIEEMIDLLKKCHSKIK